MNTAKINDIFKQLRVKENNGNISIFQFIKSIENIIMELSPNETNHYYDILKKKQHQPGGATNPPIPKNVQKLYKYLNINYVPSKKLYFCGPKRKKGHGKAVAYNQLANIATKSRHFIKTVFNL